MAPVQPYGFQAEPQPVQPRTKYRPTDRKKRKGFWSMMESDLVELPMNIHQDPRVCRGSNYGARATEVQQEVEEVASTETTKQHLQQSARCQRMGEAEMIYSKQYGRASNQSEELDLAKYLVEAVDPNAGEDRHECTQTDAFIERPSSPAYVPQKTGVDASTQILEEDKLFDFDLEVEPLLDVLVGKTLEQGLLEVEQEWELEQIQLAAAEFGKARSEEARIVAAMEKKAIREHWEKESRRRIHYEIAHAQHLVRAKVASCQLMKQMLPGYVEGAMAGLLESGSWTTPTQRAVRDEFLPWLVEEASRMAVDTAVAYEIAQDLLSAVNRQADAEYDARTAAIAAAKTSLEEARAAQEKKKREVIRLYMDGACIGKEDEGQLGPIIVTAGNSIHEAEAAITEWLEGQGIDSSPPEGGWLGDVIGEVAVANSSMTLLEVREASSYGGKLGGEEVVLGVPGSQEG